jgi:hypothetical protein
MPALAEKRLCVGQFGRMPAKSPQLLTQVRRSKSIDVPTAPFTIPPEIPVNQLRRLRWQHRRTSTGRHLIQPILVDELAARVANF